MPVVYIRNLEQEGSKPVLCDLTMLSPGSPPNRPTPGPNPPDGIWGPTDPRPENPIQLPPWAGGVQPPGGGAPVLPEGSKLAVVTKAVEQPTVPESLPAGSVLLDVKFGKDQEGQAWGLPYKSPHV